jgi:hypothetical protein
MPENNFLPPNILRTLLSNPSTTEDLLLWKRMKF